MMLKIQDMLDYNVIRFSVQELLDMTNITFADLLCAIYKNIFE